MSVRVVGLDKVRESIRRVQALARRGRLARIYHSGATGPRGQRYEHFVQDYEEQAWMHVGRWQTQEDVADEYRDLAADWLAEALEGAWDGRYTKQGIETLARQIRDRMKEYPPPPANSRYVRTGRLRAGWHYETL